jgi:hypothetical protein
MSGWNGRRWWLACGLVFWGALAVTVPTTGDIGLTWDEPAYRWSQLISVQWWERWGQVRTWADVQAQLDPNTLLYYWPYGRFGINFHPPLAGQLNLLTYNLFGSWMKDIPARRMASVLEYALTITTLFGFLASRYGPWVGGVAAGSLLLMPRLYGDGHIAGTDTPGLLLWGATAIAFWKALHEPRARAWRVLVGVLLGLAFVEKMGAVAVLGPLLVWLIAGHLVPVLVGQGTKADGIDGLVTSSAMLLPLGLVYLEIRRLADAFLQIQRALGYPADQISPSNTDLFTQHPPTDLPGAILLVPLAVWVIRRLLGWIFRKSPVWSAERPALETWTAILAFAPAVGWLGNPAWWRESLPRLAHYYAISTARRGVLPDIQILYFGQIYEYSLPWHNAWVLIAITVPAGILIVAVLGLLDTFWRIPRDRLPLYFLVHLVTLPVLRMLPTPAHDGVRLFLPTFFFLAAMAGWGLIGLADALAKFFRARAVGVRTILSGLVLGSAAWQLIQIHPYELSYYNELIGGPRGARRAGFELTYWYDALNGPTLAALNRQFPQGATVEFASEQSNPVMVMQDLQSLGKLRGDLRLGAERYDEFPFMWLLTHDSKANAHSRLLYAMHPWFESRPRQLDGLRILAVADPVAVSRAWALWLLTDDRDRLPPDPPTAPAWVRAYVPWLTRFWGDGVTKVPHLAVNEPVFAWACQDPEGLRGAAKALAEGQPIEQSLQTRRLWEILTRPNDPGASRWRFETQRLLRARPEALPEAVEILIRRPDAVRAVLRRYPYTEPELIGGDLDRDLTGSD